MQARGALMMEHRLIERMIAQMEKAANLIEQGAGFEPGFISAAVDFIRTYADRTHHGKEEDILFRELDTKDLSAQDREMMNALIDDHKMGRVYTQALAEANARYSSGERRAAGEIAQRLRDLVTFYPPHIEKEDKLFFPASREYLSDSEDQAMLAEFWEFDRHMIHEKYSTIVEHIED